VVDDRTCVSVPGAYGISLTGRRDRNEDALLAVDLGDALLLAVADGLGGHAAGGYASRSAITILEEGVWSAYRPDMTMPEIGEMLSDIYGKAHRTILNEAKGEYQGMGTTMVSALVRGDDAVIANTGDSRGYLVGKEARCITRDHSFVQSLVENGVITAEDARHHPMRNILSSSLGGSAFQVDLFHVSLRGGTTLLILCSDGLSGFVSEEDMAGAGVLLSAEMIARRLVDLALERSDDNVSVVVYRCGSVEWIAG